MHSKIFILLVFFVFNVSTCSQAKLHLADYLAPEQEHKTREIRWIIKRADSGQWGNNADELAENLRQVSSLASIATREGVRSLAGIDNFRMADYGDDRMFWLRSVLDDLMGFSHEEPHLLRCHNIQARIFLGFVKLKFGGLKKFSEALKSPPPNGPLSGYLLKYGPKHIEECAKDVIPHGFQEDLRHLAHETELRLDTLVASGQRLLPDEADVRLIARAETLDWARGKFDAHEMLNAVRPLMSIDEQMNRSRFIKPDELLASFITKTCKHLRSTFAQIDMFNLARVVVPDSVIHLDQLPIKIRKVIEYSRLCIPFVDLDTRDAAAKNVKKQMKSQKWINRLF